MANLKSESLSWLDQISVLADELQKTPRPSYDDLAKTLKVSKAMVSYLSTLKTMLEPAAIDSIRQAAQATSPFTFSFSRAKALIGLKGKVPDLPKGVNDAIEVVIIRRLETRHVEALVEHMAGGKSAKEFDHSKVKRKSAVRSSQPPYAKVSGSVPAGKAKTGTSETPNEVNPENEVEEGTQGKPTGLALWQRVAAAWEALSGGSQGKKAQKELKKAEAKVVKPGEKAARKGWHKALQVEHEFFRWVAGLIVPHPGRGSTGLRQLLAPLHWAAYGLCQLVFGWLLLGFLSSLVAPGIRPWVAFPFRYAAYWLFDFVPAWAWSLAVVHWGYAIAAGVLLLMGIFAAFKAQPLRTGLLVLLLLVGWHLGRAWGSNELPQINLNPPQRHEALRQAQGSPKNDQGLGNGQNTTAATETTIPPRRREATKLIKGSTPNSKLLTPNSSKPAPNYLPSHAWTSSDEDMAIEETELAAMPDGPGLIKDFPVEVDTSMQPDMAGTRTQDLTDHDLYSVRIGRDKKDIQAVVPGSSTLVLGFSKGLLGNLADPLGGGNNGVKIIWEDIQAIHCYEWDGMGDHPRKIYVCALLIPEKLPVIVQCGSPTDMAHFVSALEFWIRNARHGTGVPLGGLPYIHQGVLLNDGCDEKAVWENSPMGQAGLSWGDRLWSVDTNTYGRQSRDALVKSLDTLAPGKHNLFVVASKDWDRARQSEDFHSEAPFNPARRVVVLTLP